MVHRVLSKYGEDTADDLTQETFLIVLTNPERYSSRNNFKGWLVTIAMNVARDHFRKVHSQRRKKTSEKLAKFEDVRNIPVPDPLARQTDSDFLRHLVQRLPADQRAMVEGVYLNEKSWKEAAADAGIPVGTAHHVLNRGLERLRERLIAEADTSAA
jgi:RNA polymerase sigma-70 factor (ECF subfamily)